MRHMLQPPSRRGAVGSARADGAGSHAQRLPSLTGLRFVAAAGVVYTHSFLLMNPHADEELRPEVWVGASAVSLFFILSGYVLTYSARATDTTRAFLRRRVAKIFPNHVVTWCVVVTALLITSTAATTSATGVAAHLSNLVLVNTWIPGERFVLAGNPPSWSLAAEMFFYLLFPLLLPLINRLSRRGLLIGAGTAIALTWTWPLICALIVGPDGTVFFSFWSVYLLPLARLPEFALGMMTARIALTGIRLPRIGAVPAGLSVIGVIVFGSRYLPQTCTYAAATVLPIVLLVHATAELDRQGKPSLLRTSPAVFLGEISYAMYLVHGMMLALVVMPLRDREWHPVAIFPLALPLVVLAAWSLYRGVESPCMRRFSRPRARTA
ncbi:acyltransferase family protein [Streptomyces cucumeris]|uniref:acyltransferase family protein n=2 Tax=Streptomyces cucumeris TaxID=2962890 RepID=UPI003EB9F88A